MADIVLDHVTKRYPDGFEAVKEMDLEIADGEFVILVGPSGCGKSTALRMIAGLEDITEGVLRIGGEVVNDKAPKDRNIAMVFQNYALYPHMTVRDNMGFALKLAKTPKQEIATKVEEAARILDLEQHLDRKPANLSGGQRQRVAMGRAIVREPSVFLMDEPLSNLDAKLRVQMRAEISKLRHRLQTTIVYVTHDQTEAMTMGDRIVVMKDGFIQQVDTPMNLYNHPKNMFVAGFIGSPATNFIKVKLIEEDGMYCLINSDLKISTIPERREALTPYLGKEIILGIRPEKIMDNEAFLEAHQDWVVDVKIEVVEPMGSESVVYFSLNGVNVTARVNSTSTAEVLTHHKVAFDMEQARYFDPDTEDVIHRQGYQPNY